MSIAQQLVTRHAAELRGLGGSLPEELERAAAALEGRLSDQELERWAETGVALASRSLRSWEAAAEYFRVSPSLVPAFDFESLMEWAAIGGNLAESSSLIASAFFECTPDVLSQLPPPGHEEVGLQGQYEQRSHVEYSVKPWADLGERLYSGNWKSISLASLFFRSSSRLLDSLTMSMVDEFVDLVEALSERSYQLATSCLEGGPELFEAMTPRDRAPFIRFARAVARASWADTRLYFERGPALLEHIEASERAHFLELAARVTAAVTRQGFPLFVDAAEALATVDRAEHGELLNYADRLAAGSALAAMSFLTAAPFVSARLTGDQLDQWYQAGRSVLYDERNAEGAEAYFRLESTRAEEVLAALSARVELGGVLSTLRLYSKALTGEPIGIRSTEDLVDSGIGWVEESVATTEGTSIYLPPYVGTFGDREQNFLSYKVYATHQTGRIEFGSFAYRLGQPGAYTGGSLAGRLNGADVPPAPTEMQRLYGLFEERPLIAALFTIVEDTRVDAVVAREYGGIRAWLRELQSHEAGRRPDVSRLGLREAYVENLLRASLGRPDTIRWPQVLRQVMADGLGALRVVEQEGAIVQDSADVAAVLYDLTIRLPNEIPDLDEAEWSAPDDEMMSLGPTMPGGEGGDEQGPMPQSSEQPDFNAPAQPEFRGDFKPELVQLLMQLKLKQDQQDGVVSPMTPEQLKELLENSPDLQISEIAEGEFASSLGLFLTNLEKEGGTPQTDAKAERGEREEGEEGEEPGEDEQSLAVEVQYSYYDEWDFRASDYRPRWCRIGERPAEEGELDYYEGILEKHHGLVLETRRQFEMMRPESFRRIKKLEDGEGIDLDQVVEFLVDKKAGVGPLGRVYWRRNKVERDVVVAFLVDMSASTDEEIDKQPTNYDEEEEFQGDPRKYFQWLAERRARATIEPPKRIIDLEKEALVLVVEALEAIGDSYGIYGFSGYGRDNVEYHVIKDLEDTMGDAVRKRIDKIQPVRSTRMGPAIRHTVDKLNNYAAKVKLLIMVSDGRPQDHGYGRDRTEKDYAVHDTHQALLEAKHDGVTPFLITVDKEGHDYLKQMCDDVGYEVVDNIESLPRRLTSLYRALATE